MSNEITKLNAEIANLEDEKEAIQSKVNKAGNQYTIAIVGILLGLLLILFTSMYLLGGLIFVAGALAVLTQGSNKRKYEGQIEALRKQIHEKRNKIIGLSDQ